MSLVSLAAALRPSKVRVLTLVPVSVYSGGSNPPSSFNSPSASTFPIPRDPNSQSPPLVPPEGGIRLPNAPLSDIASLQSSGPSPPTPRKAATMPVPYYPSSPAQQVQHIQAPQPVQAVREPSPGPAPKLVWLHRPLNHHREPPDAGRPLPFIPEQRA